jgi:uncharacterized protein YkwD
MAGTARRSSTIAVAILLCAMTAISSASPAVAATASPSAESLMVRLINRERELRGLRPLARNLQMVRLGREWASSMAARGRVEHRTDLALHVDGDFRRLGENVGFTKVSGVSGATLVRRLHRSFMESPGHRYHVLGDYNMVGVGIRRSPDGAMWMAVNFLKGPRDGFPLFRDVDGRAVARSVRRLFVPGLVGGCGGNRFCPRQTSTRAQIAKILDSATGSRYASATMTQTCGSRSSCSDSAVTRIEAARMIAAALDLDPIPGRTFSDVASSSLGVVNAVVLAGIMSGCESTRFCPSDTIRRGQLARMMARAVR